MKIPLMFRSLYFVILFILVPNVPAQTEQAANQDWNQWRGPNRDGKSSETGLNQDWRDKRPELLWRINGLGGGMSSVAISDGKLYTMGKVKALNRMFCRHLEDGTEIWTAPLKGKGLPNCTPTVDPVGGLVFGVSKDGELSAVSLEDGKVAWSKSLVADFGGKMMSGWGFSESPLVDGDHLICTPGAPDALIVALKKSTGDLVWKTDVSDIDLGDKGKDGAGYGSLVISNAGGVKQYVQMTGHGLVGVSSGDGKFLWNYNRIANGTANIPTPVVSGDYVFGSTGYKDGGSALLKLESDGDGIAVTEVYHYGSKELQNHHGGMILVDGKIYLGSGHNNGFPQCVDMLSGELLWGKQRGAGSGSAAIVFADGNLYFRYEDHTMALVEANPEKYLLKGSFRLDSSNGKSWPHPVIQNGKLYLRDQGELLVYDVSE